MFIRVHPWLHLRVWSENKRRSTTTNQHESPRIEHEYNGARLSFHQNHNRTGFSIRGPPSVFIRVHPWLHLRVWSENKRRSTTTNQHESPRIGHETHVFVSVFLKTRSSSGFPFAFHPCSFVFIRGYTSLSGPKTNGVQQPRISTNPHEAERKTTRLRNAVVRHSSHARTGGLHAVFRQGDARHPRSDYRGPPE